MLPSATPKKGRWRSLCFQKQKKQRREKGGCEDSNRRQSYHHKTNKSLSQSPKHIKYHNETYLYNNVG
ncbi:hypothetical protein Hanom_Chr04g00348911 [Helianthus anomalus]